MKSGSFEADAECGIYVLRACTVFFVSYRSRIFIFIEPSDEGNRHVYCQRKANGLENDFQARQKNIGVPKYLRVKCTDYRIHIQEF